MTSYRHNPSFVLSSWENMRRKAMVLLHMCVMSRERDCAGERRTHRTGVSVLWDVELSTDSLDTFPPEGGVERDERFPLNPSQSQQWRRASGPCSVGQLKGMGKAREDVSTRERSICIGDQQTLLTPQQALSTHPGGNCGPFLFNCRSTSLPL